MSDVHPDADRTDSMEAADDLDEVDDWRANFNASDQPWRTEAELADVLEQRRALAEDDDEFRHTDR